MNTVETTYVSPHSSNAVLPAVPVRIQRSRQHKQVSPNGLPIVYVGRPSKWGNPFELEKVNGGWLVLHIQGERVDECGFFKTKLEAQKHAVERLRDYVSFLMPAKLYGITDEDYKQHEEIFNEFISELKGKNLSCWCKVGEPCHADVLLELANR